MCLELGEGVFDWVEVGTVGRQVEKFGVLRLDRIPDAGDLVGGQVVHDDDIAWLQSRRQHLLDPSEKAFSVHRSVEQHWRDEACQRQTADEGNGGAAFRQPGDGETSAENLGNLLRQVSKTSMDEIDNLISELQTLRRKLQTDGDRIQRDITKYAELSQQVMQLTTIISDSVKKLPGAPSISWPRRRLFRKMIANLLLLRSYLIAI